MANYRAFIVLCFLVVLPVKADEVLNISLVSATLNTVDWLQTKHIAKSGQERNFILGSVPKKREVNMYFASTTILILASNFIPPELAKKKTVKNILTMLVVGQVGWISMNYSLGWKATF